MIPAVPPGLFSRAQRRFLNEWLEALACYLEPHCVPPLGLIREPDSIHWHVDLSAGVDSPVLLTDPLIFQPVTTPADAEIPTSQVFITYLDTAGAPVVTLKGKDSAGTVFTTPLKIGEAIPTGTLTPGAIPYASDADTFDDSWLTQSTNTVTLTTAKTMNFPSGSLLTINTASASVESGGVFTIKSGGHATVASGGEVTLASGSTVTVNGSASIGSTGTLTTHASSTATFNGTVNFTGTVTGVGLDITGLTADDVATDDTLPFYDTGGAGNNKITLARLAGFIDPGICDGRLTASSSDPTGETFAATLYFLPYCGSRVALYDGTRWSLYTFSSVSITNSGLSDGSVYDVFLYDNSGTLTLELTVWTSTTARATAIVRQDGVWVKDGATTRRYLGTVYIPTGTNFTDLANTPQRYIWNYYNRVWREMSVQETEDTHDYTTATWRQYSSDSTNKVEFVIGVSEDDVEAEVATTFTNTSAVWAATGIGVSSTSANSARFHGTKCAANQYAKDIARYRGRPGIGYRYLAWLEISEAAGTTTWHNTFFVSDVRGGLMAGLWA